VDVCEDRTSKTGAEDNHAGHVWESAAEEGGYGAGEDRVQGVDAEPTEACPATGVGDKVTECTADAGGNGLLVDEGDGRASLQEALLLAVFVG